MNDAATCQRSPLVDGASLEIETLLSGARERRIVLSLEIAIDLESLQRMTGLQSEREIAAWLVEQRGEIEHMAHYVCTSGGYCREGAEPYLNHAAACDRESGRLPTTADPRCVCGEHRTRAAETCAPECSECGSTWPNPHSKWCSDAP